MTKNAIIVKKYYVERWVWRLFVICLFVVEIILACRSFGVEAQYIVILLLPPNIISVAVLLYYETWAVIVSKNGIQKCIYGHKSMVYQYAQFKSICLVYSHTDHYYILLKCNNNSIKFRMKDFNAAQAIHEIRRHRSIQTQHK